MKFDEAAARRLIEHTRSSSAIAVGLDEWTLVPAEVTPEWLCEIQRVHGALDVSLDAITQILELIISHAPQAPSYFGVCIAAGWRLVPRQVTADCQWVKNLNAPWPAENVAEIIAAFLACAPSCDIR